MILDSAAHRCGLNTYARIENNIQTRRPSIQGQWNIFGSTNAEMVKNLSKKKEFGKLKKFNAWDPKFNKFGAYYRESEKIQTPELSSGEKKSLPRGPYAKPFGPVYVDHNE